MFCKWRPVHERCMDARAGSTPAMFIDIDARGVKVPPRAPRRKVVRLHHVSVALAGGRSCAEWCIDRMAGSTPALLGHLDGLQADPLQAIPYK